MNLYEILGIDKTADAYEIKTAYRSAAQKNHPDKGGDAEEFKKIQHAYEVLSNHENRARYDETGLDHDGPSIHERAMNNVNSKILACLDSVDVDTNNLVILCVHDINRQIAQFDQSIRSTKIKIKKIESAIKRLVRKGLEENTIGATFQGAIKIEEMNILHIEENLQVAHAMLEILNGYEYTTDKAQISEYSQRQNSWFGNPQLSPWQRDREKYRG